MERYAFVTRGCCKSSKRHGKSFKTIKNCDTLFALADVTFESNREALPSVFFNVFQLSSRIKVELKIKYQDDTIIDNIVLLSV